MRTKSFAMSCASPMRLSGKQIAKSYSSIRHSPQLLIIHSAAEAKKVVRMLSIRSPFIRVGNRSSRFQGVFHQNHTFRWRAQRAERKFSPMSLRLLDLISRNPYISQSTLQTPWAPVRVSLSLWTSATLPSSGLLRGLLLSTRVNSRVGSSRVSVDVVGHEIKSSWD